MIALPRPHACGAASAPAPCAVPLPRHPATQADPPAAFSSFFTPRRQVRACVRARTNDYLLRGASFEVERDAVPLEWRGEEERKEERNGVGVIEIATTIGEEALALASL